MKSKPVPVPKKEEFDRDDEIEIDDGAPSIASVKRGKGVIIIVSVFLSAAVVYIFFFSGNEKPQEKLEIVEAPKPTNTIPSESNKPLFDVDNSHEDIGRETNIDLLTKPSAPEIPTVPELPKDVVLPDQLNLSAPLPPAPTNPDQQQAQVQQNPTQDSQVAAKPQDQLTGKKPQNKLIDPRYAPIVVFSGAVEGSGPASSVGYDKNIVKLNKDPIDELEKTTTKVNTNIIADRSHTIAQGKFLTAILETAINTEVPGSVRGIISRDVYGESGNEVLIPKGSRLFGSYSSEIKRGQGRVQINWSRLIRQDGVSLDITFNASDQFGRAGMSGDVDNKYSSIVTNSLLTSILAVGGVAAAQKLLGNNSPTTTTNNPTQGTTTTTGNAANQALYDVSKTIIDTVGQIITSTIDLNPIIRVPQGSKITVIVNSDIVVPSIRKK